MQSNQFLMMREHTESTENSVQIHRAGTDKLLESRFTKDTAVVPLEISESEQKINMSQ